MAKTPVFLPLEPCSQVESVFETLVEDSPEEESTLTSKMCACESVWWGEGVAGSLCAWWGAGHALPLSEETGPCWGPL